MNARFWVDRAVFTPQAQSPDAVTLALTGGLPFVLLISAVLALLISLFLLRRYRRAVTASMRRRAMPGMSESAAYEATPPPPQTELDFTVSNHAGDFANNIAAQMSYAKTQQAPRRAARIYTAAGLCCAVLITAAFLAANKAEFFPLRFFLLNLVFAWPVVLTVNLVAASSRRAKWTNVFVYFFVFGGYWCFRIGPQP